MKSAMIFLFIALILATITPSFAQDKESEQTIFNRFMLHAFGTYGENLKGSDSWTPEERQNWLDDANNNASLLGYALHNLKQYSSNWNGELDRLFLTLKTKSEIWISEQCEKIAERKKWKELEMRAHEAEAYFSFNETFTGVQHRIKDMIELTGVRPENAPDFFAELGYYRSTGVDEPKPTEGAKNLNPTGHYQGSLGHLHVMLMPGKFVGRMPDSRTRSQLFKIRNKPVRYQDGSVKHWTGQFLYMNQAGDEEWIDCTVTMSESNDSPEQIILEVHHKFGVERFTKRSR